MLALTLSLSLNVLAALVAIVFVRRKGGWRYIRSKLVAAGAARDPALELFEHAYARNRAELYALLPVVSEDVVLLGDSLTEHCLWHELFGDARLKGRGISGDTSEGLLARLEPLLRARPRMLLVMIGINDINQGRPVAAIEANVARLVARAKERAPSTRLVLQSVLPIDGFRWGQTANARILELNDRLKALAVAEGLVYLDLHARFWQDGNLAPGLSPDGLHLNAAGYALWREALAPLLSTAGR